MEQLDLATFGELTAKSLLDPLSTCVVSYRPGAGNQSACVGAMAGLATSAPMIVVNQTQPGALILLVPYPSLAAS